MQYRAKKVLVTGAGGFIGSHLCEALVGAGVDEKHPLRGQSPYSASKIGADKIAESYHRSFNVPVATIRPFNTYGPRQSARAVIPTIISQALSEPKIRLGALTPIRDLTFVKDMTAAYLAIAAADGAIGKTLNVGAGEGITIGDLTRLTLDLMACKKPVVEDSARLRPEASEVFQLICDNRLAREVTGWKPAYTLKQGLPEAIGPGMRRQRRRSA